LSQQQQHGQQQAVIMTSLALLSTSISLDDDNGAFLTFIPHIVFHAEEDQLTMELAKD